MSILSMREAGLPTNSKLIIPSKMIQTMSRVRGAHNLLADPGFRRELGLIPGLGGGSQPTGFHTEGDVIRETVDGVSTVSIWQEFQQVLAALNARRQPIVDLLTFAVQNPVETVPQVGSSVNFERASEFGLPVAVRTGLGYFQMGYTFEWYDTGARYTWRYLAEATAQQIQSVFSAILEGDSRLVFNEVMRTLFSSAQRSADINDRAYNVYPFYNADGTVPPQVGETTFTGSHTHYVISGAATITSGDLDEGLDDLESHGYSGTNGYNLVILVNKAEGNVIRTFKSIQNGGTARWDFIPAQGTPNFLLPREFIVNSADGGQRPTSSYRGIPVIGSYGDALILQHDIFPAGYVVTFATGGDNNLANPIGIREHARPELRGLRMVQGRRDDYPLQDSYWQRGFGTGVRHRGGTYIMQIKASGSYVAPTKYS
jgi:hypothetical protein